MGALMQLLGLEAPCPGYKMMWWGGSIKCKLPARHRGNHENGRHSWPYGGGG